MVPTLLISMSCGVYTLATARRIALDRPEGKGVCRPSTPRATNRRENLLFIELKRKWQGVTPRAPSVHPLCTPNARGFGC